MPAGSKVAQVESKLKKEYGNNPGAVYGTLNKIGLMKGNKATKKGLQRASQPKRRKAKVSQNAALMSRMAMG